MLASRLSASARNSVLLLEAGVDTPPGEEPADIRDPYPASYYNKSRMWPRVRSHWRRRDNSPAGTFPQARVMGGGSSVMGMIALRGTPDDYDEWAAAGASGWGWEDVLPWFRRLENDLDFDGPLHGKDGPVPIRRIREDAWPPLTRAIRTYADERQIPFVADMNADFRDGYGALPMSNRPDMRASAAMCYLGPEVRRRPNLEIVTSATVTGLLFERRRVAGVAVQDEIGRADRPRARNHPLRRGDPFAGDADARRHRPGGGAPRARHRRGGRSPGRRREPAEPRDPVPGVLSRAGGPPAEEPADASDDLLPLFLRPSRLPAHRPLHQHPEQDVVERARPAYREPRASALAADGAWAAYR